MQHTNAVWNYTKVIFITSEILPPSSKSTCKLAKAIKVTISTMEANLPIVWIVSEGKRSQFVAAALAQGDWSKLSLLPHFRCRGSTAPHCLWQKLSTTVRHGLMAPQISNALKSCLNWSKMHSDPAFLRLFTPRLASETSKLVKTAKWHPHIWFPTSEATTWSKIIPVIPEFCVYVLNWGLQVQENDAPPTTEAAVPQSFQSQQQMHKEGDHALLAF